LNSNNYLQLSSVICGYLRLQLHYLQLSAVICGWVCAPIVRMLVVLVLIRRHICGDLRLSAVLHLNRV